MDFNDFEFGDESSEEEESESGFDLDHLGSDDDEESSSNYTGNSNKLSKKTAIAVIGVGIGAFLIICIIASFISGLGNKSSNRGTESSSNNTNNQQVTNVTPSQPNTSYSAPVSNTNNSNGWTEFNSASEIIFQEGYKELVFTVTEIHHYVKTEGSNALSIKTTLTGSLSGMSGTYELDIPYDKGSKLSVGTEFTVNVQLGEYNGRTVIGEVTYK